MINRVLIRMKTVQLLYSYLLVATPFSLESQPSAPTKEKRFAYTLYLDLIMLMDRLAHQIKGKNKSYPLAESRFVMQTEKDEKIKSLAAKYQESAFPFSFIESQLSEQIKESLLFREFEKERESGQTPDKFWENVFNAIILPDEALNSIIRLQPGYTLSGMERMKGMMEQTFRNFYSSRDNIDDALKTLKTSLLKARDLYMRLLALPVELTKLRLDQLERNRQRYLAMAKDLNPNMKLINNQVARLIENNPEFAEYQEKNHLSWKVEDPELLDLLLRAVLQSDIYKNYEESPDQNVKGDSQFWQDIITEVILNNKDFLEYLENKSVFWNDDLEIMASFVVKTLKRLENPETVATSVMPMYKDGEDGQDAHFGADLFRYVIKNKELYNRYIEETLAKDKWDTERLAFMDVVITMTALAEIINYPQIPLNVSINEYIEIAKSYSSAKSGQFVHGLLASIIGKLKEDKIIYK